MANEKDNPIPGENDPILNCLCQAQMKLQIVDEGDMAVFWCPQCGSIWVGEYFGVDLGEGEFKSPKNFKE